MLVVTWAAGPAPVLSEDASAPPAVELGHGAHDNENLSAMDPSGHPGAICAGTAHCPTVAAVLVGPDLESLRETRDALVSPISLILPPGKDVAPTDRPPISISRS